VDDLIILLVRGIIRLLSGGKEQQQKRAMQRPVPLSATKRPSPARPPPLRRPPMTGRQQPPMRIVPAEAPPRQVLQVAAPTALRPAVPPAAPPPPLSVSAASLRRWLRPEVMRNQFILTEIFQPPLALRPPGDKL